MISVVVRRPGGRSVLEVREGPDPVPGPGQVRVRSAAAGVNYADCLVRMGYYAAARGLYPIVPGFEFAGEVDALGPGVEGLREGERVLGVTRFGGYAGLQVVDRRQVWPCPKGWSPASCAAFPAVFLTAWYGLHEAARVREGERLLIHSAAGGVGTALLQLSRIAGCRSTAVVGAPAKADLCRRLGATEVIDRSSEDLWDRARRHSPGGYDAVFDANGVGTLSEGYSHLAPGGRLVVYGFAELFSRGEERPGLLRLAWNRLRVPSFSPLKMTFENRGVVGFNLVNLFDRFDLADGAMRRMLGWAAEGRLEPVPVREFPFERAGEAHAALESGATTGKLVLTFNARRIDTSAEQRVQ